jgi:cell division protein FtsW (lipid II flippase)
VAVISAVFIITILALVSGLYGNPEAPVTKWLDLYGGRLIGAEILVFVMISVAALVTDRRQTLRERNQSSPTRAASPASKPDFH